MEYTVKQNDDGTTEWYVGDWLHKEGGPARELADGTKEWWSNGERHREDGPAIEFEDGKTKWFYLGKNVTEEEHAKLVEDANRKDEPEEEAPVSFSVDDVKNWLADTLLKCDDPESGLQSFVQSYEQPDNSYNKAPYVWLSALTVVIAILLAAEMYLLYYRA